MAVRVTRRKSLEGKDLKQCRLWAVERLEARTLLAAVNWTGAGDGVNWTNPANWSNFALPTVQDDVTIDVPGSDPTIQLNSGTHTIRSLVCNENFVMVANLTVVGNAVVNGVFTHGGGTLSGSGDFTINGTLNWNAGNHIGSGATIIPAGSTVNLNGGGLGRTLDLAGTGNLAGSTSLGTGLGDNGTLNVLSSGVLNVSVNGSINSNGGTAHALNNSGTINRLGTGTSTFFGSPLTVTNNGTIHVDAGTLAFGCTLVNNGLIDVDAGCGVSFSRNATFATASSLTGGGNASFNDFTQTFAPGTFALTGNVAVGGGNVNFDGNVTLNSLNQFGGIISGNGDVTLAGTSTWSNGSQVGGKTIVPAGATLNLPAAGGLGRVLEVAGTANISGSNFSLGNGTTVNGTFNVLPSGTLNITSTGFAISTNGGTAHQLNNSGTIVRSGTGVSSLRGALTLTNNATISVSEGTLGFEQANTSNNGTIAVSGGAAITLQGNIAYNAGSTLTGAGNGNFNAGTHTFAAGTFSLTGAVAINGFTTVNFNGAATLSGLTINSNASPALGGSGDVTINGPLNWIAGRMGGTGRTILAAGHTSTASGALLARVLDVAGTLNMSGTFTFGDGTTANGTMNMLAGGTLNLPPTISTNGSGAFVLTNAGTINRPGGAATVFSNPTPIAITNTGTISIGASATLNLGTNPLTNNGTISVAAGALFATSANGTHNSGSVLTGAGNARFNNGTHNFAPGTFSLTGQVTLDTSTPVVNFNGNVTLSGVTHNRGDLGGSGDIALAGTYAWAEGRMRGTGKTIISVGESINVTGTNQKNLARTIDLGGTLNYTGQGWNFGDGTATGAGTINVLTGATMNFNGGGGFGTNGTAQHAINNHGTINRFGAGQTTFSSPSISFNNFSTVNINAGILFLTTSNIGAPGFLTAGRYVIASGASLQFNSLPTEIAADIELHGTATVSPIGGLRVNRGRIGLENGANLTLTPGGGTFTQHGILDLSPTSTFTVNGNMVFAGTSQPIIRTEIASAVQFGRVIVNGNLDLNSPDSTSRFDPDLVSGFDPPSGTAFNTIQATTVANAFDSFFGGITPSNLILLLTRPNDQTVAVEVGTGTPPPPPQILSVDFDFQTREALVFAFDQDVSAFLSRKDFRIENLTTQQTIPQSAGLLTYNSTSNQATLLLTHQLPDGNYRLTIQASDIANPAGVPATDGITFDFHVLKGDANRDKLVNLSDFNVLAANFGQTNRTFSQGDFNYDGQVNLADFNILAARFGVSLSSPAAGRSAGASTSIFSDDRLGEEDEHDPL